MRPRPRRRSTIKPSWMRVAGAITGLLVLGTFVIPGTYGPKTDLTSEARRADGARIVSSAELDGGSATLAGRIYDVAGRPLGGALVSLAGSGFWPARSVRSAADGRFHWPDIPAGIYELRAPKVAWSHHRSRGLSSMQGRGVRSEYSSRRAGRWRARSSMRIPGARSGTRR